MGCEGVFCLALEVYTLKYHVPEKYRVHYKSYVSDDDVILLIFMNRVFTP